MKTIEKIWNDWQNGEIEDKEAIKELTRQLAVVEDSLEPLEATRKVIRDYLSVVVEQQPGSKITLKGFGNLSIRNAVTTHSYDTKSLDNLIAKLVIDYPEVAQQIAICRKESSRAGGLYILKEKTK
jgi:hypothetical protein